MKRTAWLVGGMALLLLLLSGGAFVAGRLLGSGQETGAGDGGRTLTISTAEGQEIEVEWVPSPELPEEAPDVAGVGACP